MAQPGVASPPRQPVPTYCRDQIITAPESDSFLEAFLSEDKTTSLSSVHPFGYPPFSAFICQTTALASDSPSSPSPRAETPRKSAFGQRPPPGNRGTLKRENKGLVSPTNEIGGGPWDMAVEGRGWGRGRGGRGGASQTQSEALCNSNSTPT